VLIAKPFLKILVARIKTIVGWSATAIVSRIIVVHRDGRIRIESMPKSSKNKLAEMLRVQLQCFLALGKL
jgi:hypothetical protein